LPAPPSGNATKGRGEQPVWAIGDTWTYSGRDDGKPTTLTVLGIAPDHYSVEQKAGSDINVLLLNFDFSPNAYSRFQWPLEINKQWTFHGEGRSTNGMSGTNSYTTTETVEAYEPVTVPAGTFDSFRVRGRQCNDTQHNRCGEFMVWYSPQVKSWVKIAWLDARFWNYPKPVELLSYQVH
jgi:hypothetical protein